MNVRSYPIGRPYAGADAGGDCRARDLTHARNIHGPHRFAVPSDLRIGNGIVRLTVGAAGAVPSLAVEQYTGGVVSGDVYDDLYRDVYGGIASAAGWAAMGTLIVDSPDVSALLTGARVVRETGEIITIRLTAPLIGDAYVILRRGHRAVSIQHGSGTSALARRIRWVGPPTLVGTGYPNRVQEDAPTVAGFARFVAGLDSVGANAGAFSVTSGSLDLAHFGAGIGTSRRRNQPAQLHAQLGEISRLGLHLERVA